MAKRIAALLPAAIVWVLALVIPNTGWLTETTAQWVAILCFGLGGLWLLGAAIYLWRTRHRPEATSSHRSQEVPFEGPEGADLAVFLEREEFHPFHYQANLLEAKFRIENKTDKTKHILSTTWGMDPSEDGPTSSHHDIEVVRALDALKEKRPPELHGIVGPGDTISGWVHVALPHQPWGGIGGYTVTIEDEIGTRYVLTRERRGGRKP